MYIFTEFKLANMNKTFEYEPEPTSSALTIDQTSYAANTSCQLPAVHHGNSENALAFSNKKIKYLLQYGVNPYMNYNNG